MQECRLCCQNVADLCNLEPPRTWREKADRGSSKWVCRKGSIRQCLWEGEGSRQEATHVLAESQEGPEMGVPRFHRGKAKGLRVGEGGVRVVREWGGFAGEWSREVPPGQIWNKATSPEWARGLFPGWTMELMKKEEKRKIGKFWVWILSLSPVICECNQITIFGFPFPYL